MNVPAHLRAAIDRLDLRLDSASLCVCLWAQNNAEDGTVQYIVGDGRGPRALFSRARSTSAREALAQRHAALHHELDRRGLSGLAHRLAVPSPFAVGEEIWLWRPWQTGRSGTVDGRRPFGRKRLLAQLRAALDLSTTLAEGDDAIVHYDLCPDNVLVGRHGLAWLDFEFWARGPAIDNVFDAILGWGGVLGLRPWQRQGGPRVLTVWNDPDPALVALVEQHHSVALLCALDRQARVDAFGAFLATKAERQHQVYGRDHGFARRWRAIHAAWHAQPDRHRSRWLELG